MIAPQVSTQESKVVGQTGKAELTRQEYFAAMAMQGLLSRAIQSQDPAMVARDAVLYAAHLAVEISKKPVSE